MRRGSQRPAPPPDAALYSFGSAVTSAATVAVIAVALETTTLVQSVVPILTVAPLMKFEPAIVISVVVSLAPDAGVTAATTGAAISSWHVAEHPSPSAALPSSHCSPLPVSKVLSPQYDVAPATTLHDELQTEQLVSP